jgi:hypothetical protein
MLNDMRDWTSFALAVISFAAPFLIRARSCRRKTSERSWTVKIGRFEMSRTIRETDVRS